MKFSISIKIGILSTILVTVTAATIGTLLYRESQRILTEHELTDLQGDAEVTRRRVEEQIAMLREDVFKLSGSPAVQGIMRARLNTEHPGIDPALIKSKTEEEWRKELVKDIEAIMREKAYYQIRLIGAADRGREILRVGWSDQETDLPRELNVEVNPEYRKKGRFFYDRTAQLPAQTVYLSAIELNRENNRIQTPIVPVLRAAVPIHSPGGKFVGMVVINLDFRAIARLLQPSRLQVYLTNEKGEFLVHPDSSKTFVFDKLEIPDWSQEHPQVKRAPRLQDQPGFATLKEDYKSDYEDKNRYLQKRGRDFAGPINLQDDALLDGKPVYLLTLVVARDTNDNRLIDANDVKKLNDNLKKIYDDDDSVPYYRPVTIDTRIIRLRGTDESRLNEIGQNLVRQSHRRLTFGAVVRLDTFAFHHYRIYFDALNPKRFLGLVVAASYEEFLAEGKAVRNRALLSVGLLIVSGALLSFLLSKFLTRRLKRIARATRKFAGGATEIVLPTGSGDEIGILADSFQNMIIQVRQRALEVKEHEDRLRDIFDNAAEGIVTVDERGIVRDFNQAAENIFGYQDDEVCGQEFRMLYPPSEGNGFELQLKQYLQSGVATMVGSTTQSVGRHKSGEEFPIELTMSEVVRKEGRFFTTIIRDVTERKRSEEELNELTMALRDAAGQESVSQNSSALHRPLNELVKEQKSEVLNVLQQLTVTRDEALAANRAKSAFLANMSHELRTPLNAIIGFSEDLREDAAEIGQDGFVEDLTTIISAGKHQLALINEILDLAKVEAGRMELLLEEFEVAMLVQEVSEVIRVVAKKNHNQVEVHVDERVGEIRADRTKVRQVLLNLLGNASKFTENGIVSLDVTSKKMNGSSQIQFQIRDTGIGLTAQQMERLFQPFSQADSSVSRKFGGTGLGLTISQRFCEMMGGRITVQSVLDEGSTFTVILPEQVVDGKDEPEATQGVRLSASDSGIQPITRPANRETVTPNFGKTVLVIDDDETVHELMARFLGKAGFQIQTATSGAEGLRMAEQLVPAAITLDAVMPGMDGWNVLNALKENPRTQDIPVIMVTMVDDKKRGLALGAFEYVSKPIDWTRLIEILRGAFQNVSSASILVVEEDAELRGLICDFLRKKGWPVVEAVNFQDALIRLEVKSPEIILMDLAMSDGDGIELLGRLRKDQRWSSIPVVGMTGAPSLTEANEDERCRLKGILREVIIRNSYDCDELLAEIGRRIFDCVFHGES